VHPAAVADQAGAEVLELNITMINMDPYKGVALTASQPLPGGSPPAGSSAPDQGRSDMTAAARLRELIHAPELLVMPGVFDPMSARLAARAGFAALQCTGLGISAVYLGKPDYSMLAMSDMVTATERIVQSVDVPVMADGDTGFGNAVNVHFAVQAFERAGAAGVNIEDQVMPKRCGHLDGKQVVEIEEGVTKIRAAADARRDPDFVINARTDTLATHGIEEVIRRGNAYLEAGATMIFVDGISSREEIRTAVAGIGGPVAINMIEGGRTPEGLTFEELQTIGVARVSLPLALISAAMQGIQRELHRIGAQGGPGFGEAPASAFADIHNLMGMDEVVRLEQRYLAPLRAGA
jgi:2-methylisocitrate lyase-like PEP mutase family enzyme